MSAATIPARALGSIPVAGEKYLVLYGHSHGSFKTNLPYNAYTLSLETSENHKRTLTISTDIRSSLRAVDHRK